MVDVGARVLIIDDDQNLVELLVTILQSLGVDAIPSTNGAEGLRIYEEQRPDVVIVDWVMTPYNGLELGKRIKQIDPDAVMLVITGMADPVKERAALDAGFFRFISKPFNMMAFNEYVQEALALSRSKLNSR